MLPRNRSWSPWLGRCVAVLAALTALGGCSRTSASGEATNTGLLTGYEMGNPDDYAEIRKERPDYRPFE